MKRKIQKLLVIMVAALALMNTSLVCIAADSMFDSPYVTKSPDGMYYLVGQNVATETHSLEELEEGIIPGNWYLKGTTITTGIASNRETLETGQHYYGKKRTGEIPVGKWVVNHVVGQCIHDLWGIGFEKENYAGFTNMEPKTCLYSYPSGWYAYCADCGKTIQESHIYATSEIISTIRSINVDYGYMYICPAPSHKEKGYLQGHLENQCVSKAHLCDVPSWNKYAVIYEPNYPKAATHKAGYMAKSYHMYNNETIYEGETVTPVSHLSGNGYSCEGYTLVGWNIETSDGIIYVPDSGEIFNLCEYDCKSDGDKGTVVAYGVWDQNESTLEIDANGGTYKGASGITCITQGYNTTYQIDMVNLVAPKGYTVTFEAKEGKVLDNDDSSIVIKSKQAMKEFSGWTLLNTPTPFAGKLWEGKNEYGFRGENGHVDRIRAEYEGNPIILPTAERKGYQFAGWYSDATCITGYVGVGGDKYFPNDTVTLYAKWSKLVLESVDNYVDNDKKGAVDLSWTEDNAKGKVYRLFISDVMPIEGTNPFSPIKTLDLGDLSQTINDSITSTGTTTYTVKASGVYELTAVGSAGQDYKNDDGVAYTGGKGATVTAKVYLSKGDELTFYVGDKAAGTGTYAGGSGSKFGNGGGATAITSKNLGLLIVAGGGGGATSTENGKDGGAATTKVVADSKKGENGGAGGGGGYEGGAAGDYEIHNHLDDVGNLKGDISVSDTPGGCYKPRNQGRQVVASQKKCVISITQSYLGGWNCESGYGRVNHYKYYKKHSVCGKADEYVGEFQDCPYNGHDYEWGTTTPNNYASDHIVYSYKTVYDRICGYEENEIVKSSASYGGSSYVNESVVIDYTKTAGVNQSVGNAKIKSSILGISDVTALEGVSAPDLVAPEKINEATVGIKSTLDSVAIVTFISPNDKGTQYWFKCESHPQSGSENINVSNITSNTLITGVYQYRYVIDNKNNTVVKASDSAVLKSSICSSDDVNTMRVNISDETGQWLHLAAEDTAGNLGETIHIDLNNIEVSTVHTSKVQVSSIVGGRDYRNVYVDGSNIYVRADGDSPIKFSYSANISGKANENFHVNQANYEITTGSKTQKYITKLPTATTSHLGGLDEKIKTADIKLRYQEGDSIFIDKSDFSATRKKSATIVDYYQAFAIPNSYDGQIIRIMPSAVAGTGISMQTSNRSEDLSNVATVLADGTSPVISGFEPLENMENLRKSLNGSNIKLEIDAQDALSGVRSFYAEIINEDNGNRTRIEASQIKKETGCASISLDINPEALLIAGDFEIRITAVDNVGNETVKIIGCKDLELCASLDTLPASGTCVFKAGESGVLNIKTKGYAEKVEVIFPNELSRLNPAINTTYIYTGNLEFEKEENHIFMVPLGTQSKSDYTIKIRAYKKNRVVESEVAFCKFEVNGRITMNLRTRLR